MTDFFSRFTIDVLGKAVFNHDFGRIDGHNDKYYSAYNSFWALFTTPWFIPMLISTRFSKLPVKPIKDFVESVDVLVDFCKQIIQEHKEIMDNSILSHLIAAMNETGDLSERELIANIFIFFAAGHETTASALSWAFNYLRIYPEIQQKIYEEINQVVGDRIPIEEDLEKCVYMDSFIQEVLRLRSPVSISSSRIATEDVKYKDMIIPKGSTVGIHFQMLHTNPIYWDEPEKFNPDRFSPANRKGRNHFLHIPFSAGTRQCIGNIFSLMEQKLFILRALQKYRVVNPINKAPFPEDNYFAFGKPSLNLNHVRFEKRI